ncbi:MAG: hypothetical protein CMF48_00710 [Legionellales bacterium]|nr:hypothetical protein [Legionellales bacterium]|tara:strand:+ start:804 stop:1502 length:699 start_codon:yes stop_codon:yes gene_type:complete
MSNVVAIIPARGGSKGIPRKNLQHLGGHPLISHIINTALKCKTISRVIVSTEDEEIAQTAKHYGAEVPFKRPESLAGDTVLTVPVLLHAAQWLLENSQWKPDIIVLLYPTSPLLKANVIDEGISILLNDPQTDSVASFCLDDKYHWQLESNSLQRVYPDKIMRRQDMSPLLIENGALYITRYEKMLETDSYIGGRVKPVLMNSKDSWDIDETSDFEIVDALLKVRQKQAALA